MYKGAPLRLAANISTETSCQKGMAQNIQSDEAKMYNQYYPARLSFRINGKIVSQTRKS